VICHTLHDCVHPQYKSALPVVSPNEKGIVNALVRDAVNKGLLDPMHLSITDMGMELHATFYNEMVDLHRRLILVQGQVKRTGELLFAAMEQLDCVRQYLVDKAAHDRTVALVKSAAKIGASLAPVIGGLLAVTVHVVAVLSDGLRGVKAVALHSADPTDLAAARNVLAFVRSAEADLTPAQRIELQAVVHPFESVAEVEERLAWVASVLELPCDVEREGIVEDTSSDSMVSKAPSNDDSDPMKDLKDDLEEVVLDIAVDVVIAEPSVPQASRSTVAASARSSPPLPPSVPAATATAPAAVSNGSSGGPSPPLPPVTAPRSTDAAFFADALDWTAHQVADRLKI